MKDLAGQFDAYERLLLASPAISRFAILKRRILEHEGHIRARANLSDGGLFEFSEFWAGREAESVWVQEYTYYWQDATGQLVYRWDSAAHHPELPHAPHHIHLANGTVQGNPISPTLENLLAEIERRVLPEQE